MAADLAECVERELQLLACMGGGDDGPDSRLVAGDGRERDPWANTPSANSRSDSFIASAPSPTMTGVIGLSLTPVLKPSVFRPALKNRVFSQSRSMICGSSSSTSSAAMQAAATAGGCDVENRNGRAR